MKMNDEQVQRRRREVRWAAWLIEVEEADKQKSLDYKCQLMAKLHERRPETLQSGDTHLLTGVTLR